MTSPRSPLPTSEMTPHNSDRKLPGFPDLQAEHRKLHPAASPPSLEAPAEQINSSTTRGEPRRVNDENHRPGLKRVVINVCFGGFGLSDAAYEKLIEWGVPVRKYLDKPRNPETQLYEKVEANEGEVIFDRELTLPGENSINDLYHQYKPNSVTGRYWETWADHAREHPLILRVVEELGERANGSCAKLRIVEIPADVDYVIDEYDGREHIAETHRTWP